MEQQQKNESLSPQANAISQSDEQLWTRDFGLLIMGALLQGMGFYFLLPVLPLYATGQLGAREEMVGLLVGAFSFTAVLVRPFAGFLLDRFGRRAWQLSASGLFCLTTFGYIYAHDVPTLLLVRLIHGLSWGMVGVASITVAADLIPPNKRGTGMGLYGLAMPLALSVGPMLGAILLAGDQFSRLFFSSGLLAACAFGSFFLIRTPVVKVSKARISLERVIEFRVLRLFCFMLLLCIGYGGVVAFAPLYVLQVGFDSAAPLFSFYAIGSISTRAFSGRLYDTKGPYFPIILGLSSLLCGWLLMGLWASRPGVLSGALCLGLGYGLLVPAFQAMTVDLARPGRRASANSTVFSSYDIGITIGSLGFGVVASLFGIRIIFLISSVLTVSATFLFTLWVHPHYRRNLSDQQPSSVM